MLLIIFELISITIFMIMTVSNSFKVVLNDFERRNQYGEIAAILAFMAFLGGWFLAPYFIWLVYRYYVLTHK